MIFQNYTLFWEQFYIEGDLYGELPGKAVLRYFTVWCSKAEVSLSVPSRGTPVKYSIKLWNGIVFIWYAKGMVRYGIYMIR
jgi:hypothetical protein